MRRRLDLAAGLLVPPQVMFLDEPTTGLDPRSRQQTWELVADLAAAGTTVFLTTQYLEEADRLADRVAVMDGGRLVAEGSVAELKATVGEGRLVLTTASDAAFDAVAARLEAVPDVQVGGRDRGRREIEAVTDGSADHVRALLDAADPHRADIERFTVHTATLNDVFLTLTRRPLQPTPEVAR
jgi:ABC-2 type transport system ATP-binding protein